MEPLKALTISQQSSNSAEKNPPFWERNMISFDEVLTENILCASLLEDAFMWKHLWSPQWILVCSFYKINHSSTMTMIILTRMHDLWQVWWNWGFNVIYACPSNLWQHFKVKFQTWKHTGFRAFHWPHLHTTDLHLHIYRYMHNMC